MVHKRQFLAPLVLFCVGDVLIATSAVCAALIVTPMVTPMGAVFTLTDEPSWAASHSDAPLIKQDPQANIADVYAFIGTKYNDPG